MEDSEIIEKVLLHLQGYVIDSTVTSDELSDLDYDKKVSSTEVLNFYELAKSYALTYMNREEFPYKEIVEIVEETETTIRQYNPIICNAIHMWTAGLLWKKYDIRTNNQTDETNTLGYGDILIIQSKEMLKPFKYYKMMVY